MADKDDRRDTELIGWGLILGGLMSGNAAMRAELFAELDASDVRIDKAAIADLFQWCKDSDKESIRVELTRWFGEVDPSACILVAVARRLRARAVKKDIEAGIQGLVISSRVSRFEETAARLRELAESIDNRSPPTVVKSDD